MALAPLRTQLLKNPTLQTIRFKSTAAKSVIPSWNDYFKLRKKRRLYEVASYLPSTVAPAAGTLAYFLQMQVDPLTKFYGLDPVTAAGVSTVAAVIIKFDI